MTEIAQVLANGVVRVYMGARGSGGSGLPGGSYSGNDANSDRSLRHWGVGGPTGDSNTPGHLRGDPNQEGHLRGEVDLNAEITRLRAEIEATERNLCQLTDELAASRREVESLRADADRYRWLRNPTQDVSLVIDKRIKWVPEDDAVPGAGGYWVYEYRAGDELDAAIDAARGDQ